MKYLRLPFTLYSRDKSLMNLILEVENKPGLLVRALSPFSMRGINILGMIAAAVLPGEETVINSILIDATGIRREDLQEVVNEVRKISGVVDVRLLESGIPGFTASLYAAYYSIDTDRAFILTRTAFRGLVEEVCRRLGQSACAAMFYFLGLGYGKAVARSLLEAMRDPGLVVEALALQTIALGYATSANLSKIAEDKYILTTQGLIECEALKGAAEGPTSHWIRGVIAGIFQELFDEEWSVYEDRCMNSGYPYCQFIIKKKEE